MKSAFDARIARAEELASEIPAAGELLVFYSQVARFQKQVFQQVSAEGQTDVLALSHHFPALRQLIAETGPEPLSGYGGASAELLTRHWEDPAGSSSDTDSAGRFYARALLQPFAEYLASRGRIDLTQTTRTCPFCGAKPVAAVLRPEGDGGKRSLLCSLCSTEWQFLRLACPQCGETEKDKLPVYVSEDFAHVRVEACDSCHTYIKAIDLTRDGHAVPVVDELAAVALNIWAEEHGYQKAETNLLGL